MDREHVERIAREAAETARDVDPPDPERLAKPDMGVLRMRVRPAPVFPLKLLREGWAIWVGDAAKAAAAPIDYVALTLLAAASALVGNARWAKATEGWTEPPHLWIGLVGESGSSKSPGMDCLMRDVLPLIEARMQEGFSERLRAWLALAEEHQARMLKWKEEVKQAVNRGNPAPQPPEHTVPVQPQSPRLRQSDVTVERVATLLANTAPKGLLVVRDELAGWLLGMTVYNDAGRAFWIEAYGGRPYRVERQKSPDPIEVQRLVVSVVGGTQPDKLAEMFADADDGLLARFIWGWPDPLPFRLGRNSPAPEIAVSALDRLRQLELLPVEEAGGPARPIMVPLQPAALEALEAFAKRMQDCQDVAGGLMRSAFGKARGLALRLSLVLEMLWWSARNDNDAVPETISADAFNAACALVADYFTGMAERVYGDAAATETDRNVATLARWIVREGATEVHVRHIQRGAKLPGLGKAQDIHVAAAALVHAGWLLPPDPGQAYQARGRQAYPVNPRVLELWDARNGPPAEAA